MKTKEEQAEYMRQWRKKNSKRLKEWEKEYRRKNRERMDEYMKGYKEENKEKIREYQKEYYQSHKEYHKKYKEENGHKEYMIQYNKENKDKCQKSVKEWKKKNPHIGKWRSLLRRYFRYLEGEIKSSSTFELLKYSPEEFREHLDNLGMDWNSDHVDHKIPLSWFKRDTPPHIVNDLRNLQPLSEAENRSKGSSYMDDVDPEYWEIATPHLIKLG